MRYITLHGAGSGREIRVAAERIEVIATADDGSTEVCACCSTGLVTESPAEVERLAEAATEPSLPADYAPLVDAARRLVEFLRDSDSVVTGYAPVAHALAVAIAALPAREPRDGNVEVPRG